MCKRLFAFGFVLIAFLLMCSPSWAAPKGGGSAVPPSLTSCTVGELLFPCITQLYSPGENVSRVFDFVPDSLEIRFHRIKKAFSLTIIRHALSEGEFKARLGSEVFPADSTCYKYLGASSVTPCVGYDAQTPLPIKGTDYLGPVTWILRYLSDDLSGEPAFAHAKDTSLTYTEDILEFYSTLSPVFTEGDDPSMQGDSGGLSSVAAVREPAGTDCFSWVSPQDGDMFKVGAEVEVAFRLFSTSSCVGTPIRDKDARLSVARIEGAQPVFVPLGTGGRRFHFNNDDKVNEQEFETEGLPTGTYTITVISPKFSPQSRRILLTP